jgi:hypothetical protein
METIAREIAESSSTASKRKEVYRGITALAHVCVGDIGDVISLYERIIKTANGRFPVSAQKQCDCFQDHCSHRLYDLNRRRSELKDVARSFAEASYELLVKSLREAKKNGKPVRLRQYSSIYVRVTTGDTGKQMAQLRDLIDAGVFVFTGGNPRTKTKDSDPILQFKLTFRRIYGLTNFIGLAERDRFELSGANLEEWLSNPGGGKEILLRNLGGPLSEETEAGEETPVPSPNVDLSTNGKTPSLFDHLPESQPAIAEPPAALSSSIENEPLGHTISVTNLTPGQAAKAAPREIVLGLGFEDRTLKSVQEITRTLLPAKVFAVQYGDPGKSKEILELLKSWGGQVEVVPYEAAIKSGIPLSGAPALIDVTGLAKPVIFHMVRNSLRATNSVMVTHTQAKSYYPTDPDMRALLKAEEQHNRQKFFDTLSGILTGEIGPYRCIPLLDGDADETRRNVLFAFASPKHERLLSLIDTRVIDRLEVVAPSGTTARNRVAKQIAEIAATDSASAEVTLIDSDDLAKTTAFLLKGFGQWYVRQGFNFEIGLTGSKMEAVAAAAVSSICKITQCWYVGPAKFDAARFTRGAGETRFFQVALGDVAASTSANAPEAVAAPTKRRASKKK